MVSPLLYESCLNTEERHIVQDCTAHCMRSNDFLSAVLNDVSSDGQHKITNSHGM